MNTASDIKRMENVLNSLNGYYSDRSSVFQRFLEYVIAGFDASCAKLEHPYNSKDGALCMALFQEWVMIMRDNVSEGGWYDLLGEWYMTGIASNGKKSWTGQFFTPPHICDFMAGVLDPGEYEGEKVMDNACGSGRMLLASHARHPRNYCCAQDLDRLCCLMTVCNFLIHGVNGEVVWGDGLDPADYREGWRVNSQLGITGIPTVLPMDKSQSVIYQTNLIRASQPKEPIQNAEPQPQNLKRKKPAPQYEQLSLFD